MDPLSRIDEHGQIFKKNQMMEGRVTSSAPNRGHSVLTIAHGPQESTSQAIINLLPEEMLVCIFKLVIEPHPPAIGRLPQVCQHWRYIVQMTPSLWSRILITPRIATIPTLIRYVEAAYANSANLPLEMVVDLQNFKDVSGFTDISALMKLAGSPHPSPTVYAGEVLDALLQMVLGRDGMNVARWRSLYLRIPEPQREGSLSRIFMQALQYPTPNLESLALRYELRGDHFQDSGGPLPDLKSLKHLILDAGERLEHLTCTPESVRTLHFCLWGHPGVVHLFTNLLNLSIEFSLDFPISDGSDVIITFPSLDCLTLKHLYYGMGSTSFTSTFVRNIRAPLLTTLRLIGDGALSNVADTDTLRHVHSLDLLAAPTTRLEDFIDLNLPKYTVLTTLTVCPWHLETARTRLRGLKFRGEAPVGLNLLYSVFTDKEGVVLEESTFATVLAPWRLPNEFVYRTHSLSTYAVE